MIRRSWDRITMGNCIMAKKKDDGFTQRMIVLLCTATADKNYTDVKALVHALAREHGCADYAAKVMDSAGHAAVKPQLEHSRNL